MVYILCEDTTSGYDFTKTIIKRVIKPKRRYTVLALGGCRNVNKLIDSWADEKFIISFVVNETKIFCKLRKGDEIVLLVDRPTTNVVQLSIAVEKLKNRGIKISIQAYYCFESALFSYDKFGKDYQGDVRLQDAFLEMQGMFKNERFDIAKLRRLSGISNTTGSLEQFANILFSRYFKKLSCCRVVKNMHYESLNYALEKRKFTKGFYNNLCEDIVLETADEKKGKDSFTLSCSAARQDKFCRRANFEKFDNLSDFYYNTVLSGKLQSVQLDIVKNIVVYSDYKTLDEILR